MIFLILKIKFILDYETALDRKQDFSMTLDNLCEEFRVADEIKLQKKQQKRAKKKARRQIKTNEVCYFSLQTINNRIFRRKVPKILRKLMKNFLNK